jgi:hypothetical protein
MALEWVKARGTSALNIRKDLSARALFPNYISTLRCATSVLLALSQNPWKISR